MKWRSAPVKTLLVDLDGTLVHAHDFPLRVEFTIRVLAHLAAKTGFVKIIIDMVKLNGLLTTRHISVNVNIKR